MSSDFPKIIHHPIQDEKTPSNDLNSGGEIKQSFTNLKKLAINKSNAFFEQAKQYPLYQGIITLFRNPFVQISVSIIFMILFGYMYCAVIKSYNNFYNPRPQFLLYCVWMWIWLLILIVIINFIALLLTRH